MFLQRDFDGIIEFLVGSARTVGTAFQLVRGECVPIGPWGVRSNWPVGSAFQLARGGRLAACPNPGSTRNRHVPVQCPPDPAGCKPAATGLA
jgi:hypothetical protein